jgi:hypothetical protein
MSTCTDTQPAPSRREVVSVPRGNVRSSALPLVEAVAYAETVRGVQPLPLPRVPATRRSTT